MALPSDFNKIFGSTATGGLTPISDVNYAKGWEFVGSNPPTKNDFSYLQNLSDLKAQWLYQNNYGRLINIQRFVSNGTYTPSPGTKFAVVEVIGGGGGGGSNSTTVSPGYASGGQGGNAGSRVVAKVQVSGNLSVTVGSGGSGGSPNPTSGNPGTDGGQSGVAGIIATGGRGGEAGQAYNGLPTGGRSASQNVANTIPGTVTLIAEHRGRGGASPMLYSPANASGGKGADSEYGFGGPSVAISSGINNSAGVNASGNGSGGGGSVSITGSGSTGVSVAGGSGSPGIVLIWEYS